MFSLPYEMLFFFLTQLIFPIFFLHSYNRDLSYFFLPPMVSCCFLSLSFSNAAFSCQTNFSFFFFFFNVGNKILEQFFHLQWLPAVLPPLHFSKCFFFSYSTNYPQRLPMYMYFFYNGEILLSFNHNAFLVSGFLLLNIFKYCFFYPAIQNFSTHNSIFFFFFFATGKFNAVFSKDDAFLACGFFFHLTFSTPAFFTQLAIQNFPNA